MSVRHWLNDETSLVKHFQFSNLLIKQIAGKGQNVDSSAIAEQLLQLFKLCVFAFHLCAQNENTDFTELEFSILKS